MSASALPILINKQPILNAKSEVTAFHLSIEALPENQLTHEEWHQAINSLHSELAEQGGFASIVNNKPVYYSAPIEVLQEELLPIADKNKLFIEVTAAQLSDKNSLELLRDLVAKGYKLALKDYTAEASQTKLLKLARTVKLTVTDLSIEAIKTLTEGLPSSVETILTGVDSEQLYKSLSDAGYRRFQGFYFTEPVTISSQKPETGSLAVMQLLAELGDADVDFNTIVNLIQTDVSY